MIVQVVDPQLGRTVYDPCAGTCGFLIEAFKHLMGQNPTGTQIQQLKTETLWAREDAAEAIPKAVNQNAPDLSDKRTPAQLMAIIDEAQREIAAGLASLRA